MATHDEVAARWVNRIMYPGKRALSSRNLHDRGDMIFSYGSHFEVGRILRDRKGNPVAWLLNGNRSTVTTTRHQNAVRSAMAGTGLPVVTIPYDALNAAGIERRGSVQIIDVQKDWWTTKTLTRESVPDHWWEYEYAEKSPDDDYGWINSKTGEFVQREGWSSSPPQTECDHEITLDGPWSIAPYNYERDRALRKAHEVHRRARHGEWELVTPHRRRNGRRIVKSSTYVEWELVDEPTAPLGYVFERTVHRHWLGASLIRAQVSYVARIKHQECGGTGVADEVWHTRAHPARGEFVSGPLTERHMASMEETWAYQRERYGEDTPLGWQWELEAYVPHTECRGCSGRGRVSETRQRWAYFLSGFDQNETRPSYFFCELPPKARPTTVEEALESLKPSAVKLAEQAGREVVRQGDIFSIPMPGLTLRDLKSQGGQLLKREGLLGTNHVATEVVTVGNQTYARGTITHAPPFRRPDHKRVSIGRQWNLIVKNTVPVAA